MVACVQLLRLRAEAIVPERMSAGAAGLDLSACLAPGTTIRLHPGERARIPTGWALAIPEGFEGQVRPRSGLAWRHGVTVLNAPGTIDHDYRGELQILLVNLGSEPFEITPGLRVAQLVVAAVTPVTFEFVHVLDATPRGVEGFGSTGGGSPGESAHGR